VATADAAGPEEVVFTLQATFDRPDDALVLSDVLGVFVADRRNNPGAPEAVRQALARTTIERRDGVVSLGLPLSEAALERFRHTPDTRRLLEFRIDDAEREASQRVGEVMGALGLREGSAVADVGAGDGFFTIRLARRVGPSGRVYPVELGDAAVAQLGRRAADASLPQVEPVRGAPDDPHLPRGVLDAALIVNAYHEMPQYEAMLRHLRDALKPGGRLVLVEPWSPKRRRESREDQVRDHLIAPELAEGELRAAGFEVSLRRDDFVTREDRGDWLIQARRP
jgi:SAM-dependent methyltransferase